mmetsp:Transcript_17934/g.51391  ORF Transcript_17934/g.51391 Transcript_17934/m.51391 type:complete len:333 (+) Transcript_17934:1-999(+)
MKATKRPLPTPLTPPSPTAMRPSAVAKAVGLVTAVLLGLSILAIDFELSAPSARRILRAVRKQKQKKQKHRSTQSTPSIDKSLYETDGTMSISRTNHLVYIHTPKTGGSSVENSALFDDARSHHAVGGHFDVQYMTLNAQERGIDNFVKAAHIRHPCSRFISAYAYLTSDICNPGDKLWANEHIGNLSLDDFILKLEREQSLTGKAHLRPLHHWLFHPDGTFGLDVALCQESWNESLDVLGEYLGSDRIPKELYSSHSLQNAHNSCAELRPEARQAIERVYAMDYCIFGFASEPKKECQQMKEAPEVFTERYASCVARFGPYERASWSKHSI